MADRLPSVNSPHKVSEEQYNARRVEGKVPIFNLSRFTGPTPGLAGECFLRASLALWAAVRVKVPLDGHQSGPLSASCLLCASSRCRFPRRRTGASRFARAAPGERVRAYLSLFLSETLRIDSARTPIR